MVPRRGKIDPPRWARSRAPGGPCSCLLVILAGCLVVHPPAHADEPFVTVLADFEDDAVAAQASRLHNISPADVELRYGAPPARGQRSLAVEIGATAKAASLGIDLRFRTETSFERAERIATYYWLIEGQAQLAFRLRDSHGDLFETEPVTIAEHNRWVRVTADLAPAKLKPVEKAAQAADHSPGNEAAMRVVGYWISVAEVGRQVVYLDDLEMEHRGPPSAAVRATFKFNNPTQLYEPGAAVGASILLENVSRATPLKLSVQLVWLGSDDAELKTERSEVTLPASGPNFRSRQSVDFSQPFEEPGIHRLVARVNAPGWPRSLVVDSAVGVMPSNRSLPRGRSRLFGVRSNLLREPIADQSLELQVAADIGVQLLALSTSWAQIEPKSGAFRFVELDGVIAVLARLQITPMILIEGPPNWADATGDALLESQGPLLAALAEHFGSQVQLYQPYWTGQKPPSAATLDALQKKLASGHAQAVLCPPPAPAAELAPAPQAGKKSKVFLQSSGDAFAAAAAIDRVAEQRRGPDINWFHQAAPLMGAGENYDAVQLLRLYVHAGAADLASLVLFDLRDAGVDAARPEQWTGLIRRDFSPKSTLMGFGVAAAMLSGLRPGGPVPGAPPGIESSLFVTGDQQVGVLIPRIGATLPAALFPIQVSGGSLRILDFDRRVVALQEPGVLSLLSTRFRPAFVLFAAERAQTDPQIALAGPWIRLPAIVPCGEKASFTLEIDAPAALRHSFVQIGLPKDSKLKSSVSNRALNADAGGTLKLPIELSRQSADAARPETLSIRLSIEGKSLETPITVAALATVTTGSGPELGESKRQIAALRPAQGDFPIAAPLYAAYATQELRLGLRLPDKTSSAASVLIAAVAENGERPLQFRVSGLDGSPVVTMLHGPGGELRAALDKGLLVVEIPAQALSLPTLQSGQRILLACRYAPQAGAGPDRLLEWGAAAQTLATNQFNWLQLGN